MPDSLWERVQPLLPERRRRRRLYPERKPCDDRAALPGTVFVLKTGIGWNQLPRMLFGHHLLPAPVVVDRGRSLASTA